MENEEQQVANALAIASYALSTALMSSLIGKGILDAGVLAEMLNGNSLKMEEMFTGTKTEKMAHDCIEALITVLRQSPQ
jgi:hypothetical protein